MPWFPSRNRLRPKREGTVPWVTRRVERRVSSERRRGLDRREGVTVLLTKREQEIRALISAGLGNKDIARRLNISTNTVKSHVHNMLGKLAALTPPDRRRSGSRRGGGASRRSQQFGR
ncbi:MAG TPA: LuxR C-terminal-related transcriptional regulator [Xanthobacteraceae bacterium]|nr:LuxR C-terminal-related transcriptional regulator [Xanthobacteraceae bacterium]